MLTAAAELERDLTRERVKDGVASARRNGKHLGGPRKLEKAQLEQAEILLASGKLTTADVAKMLGCSRVTLWRHLNAT